MRASYLSWRQDFGRKVCDASVETVCGDSEEHFHKLLLLLFLHHYLETRLLCLIEIHNAELDIDSSENDGFKIAFADCNLPLFLGILWTRLGFRINY
jgi:hypothetical protein